MSQKFQILNWDENFENNKSRERDECSFVCLPNKQHGMGFVRLVSEKDGAVLYGIWCMIVCACSRQKKPRSGWLTHDGTKDGIPWSAQDLSLQFRRPTEEITRALSVLSSPRIGWLSVTDVVQADSNQLDLLRVTTEVPAECPSSALEEKRREGIEKKEEAPGEPESPHRRFTRLWCEAYQEVFGFAYGHKRGRDGDATRTLLALGEPIESLIELARKAWQLPNEFLRSSAGTISGFSSRINEIRMAIRHPIERNGKGYAVGPKHTHQRPEPALKVKRA